MILFISSERRIASCDLVRKKKKREHSALPRRAGFVPSPPSPSPTSEPESAVVDWRHARRTRERVKREGETGSGGVGPSRQPPSAEHTQARTVYQLAPALRNPQLRRLEQFFAFLSFSPLRHLFTPKSVSSVSYSKRSFFFFRHTLNNYRLSLQELVPGQV
jgi:hypothetical protein